MERIAGLQNRQRLTATTRPSGSCAVAWAGAVKFARTIPTTSVAGGR